MDMVYCIACTCSLYFFAETARRWLARAHRDPQCGEARAIRAARLVWRVRPLTMPWLTRGWVARQLWRHWWRVATVVWLVAGLSVLEGARMLGRAALMRPPTAGPLAVLAAHHLGNFLSGATAALHGQPLVRWAETTERLVAPDELNCCAALTRLAGAPPARVDRLASPHACAELLVLLSSARSSVIQIGESDATPVSCAGGGAGVAVR